VDIPSVGYNSINISSNAIRVERGHLLAFEISPPSAKLLFKTTTTVEMKHSPVEIDSANQFNLNIVTNLKLLPKLRVLYSTMFGYQMTKTFQEPGIIEVTCEYEGIKRKTEINVQVIIIFYVYFSNLNFG